MGGANEGYCGPDEAKIPCPNACGVCSGESNGLCKDEKSTKFCESSTNKKCDWHDSGGTKYDCVWYAKGDRCASYGDKYRNFGLTASEACCACKKPAA